MIFMTKTTIGAIVRRTSRQSFPPDHYSPPLSDTMVKNPLPDSREPFPSYALQMPFVGCASAASSQKNSLINSLSPSPVIDHDFVVTIDFNRIQSLEENLRDFEGFLNRENVLPQDRNVVNTLRDMLISDKKGLEMLRALSIIVKNHVPLENAPT